MARLHPNPAALTLQPGPAQRPAASPEPVKCDWLVRLPPRGACCNGAAFICPAPVLPGIRKLGKLRGEDEWVCALLSGLKPVGQPSGFGSRKLRRGWRCRELKGHALPLPLPLTDRADTGGPS